MTSGSCRSDRVILMIPLSVYVTVTFKSINVRYFPGRDRRCMRLGRARTIVGLVTGKRDDMVIVGWLADVASPDRR